MVRSDFIDGKNLEYYRQLCGISVIGELEAEIDYDLYEIIEAVDTKNPEQGKRIAEVYSCGYLYKGKVKKKARVSAYHFTAFNRQEKNINEED